MFQSAREFTDIGAAQIGFLHHLIAQLQARYPGVEVRVLNVGRTPLKFGYRVFKTGESVPRIMGHNVTVGINMDSFEKIEIPGWFRPILEVQMGKDRNQ